MIRAHPVVGKAKSIDICKAFVAGAPRGAAGAVFYGVNETNKHAWWLAKQSGHDWYYVDNSYFDCVRGQQFRVTKNRVQVRPGDHSTTFERFDKLGLTITPWKPRGSRWLTIEQSPSFMQVVADDPHWLVKQAAHIPNEHTNKVRRWSPNKPKIQQTLQADLDAADTLMTHSSAAAAQALLVGVHVVVSPMSALYAMPQGVEVASTKAPYPMTARDFSSDGRRHYLGVLADNQFTLDEIRNGEAWVWLNR